MTNIENLSVDELRSLRTRAKNRIKALEAQPKEPPVGSVIVFTKHFGNLWGTAYQYAAVRSPRGWSVTGKTTLNGISWTRLLNFVRESEAGNAQRAIESMRLVEFTVPLR